MATDEIEDIIAAISRMSGTDLVRIKSAVVTRENKIKDALTRDAMAYFQEGDHVRIKDDAPLKPRYLRGATAVITEKRITKITVRFSSNIHDPYGKWAGNLAVVPASWLELVERVDS